jgi:hypothetical protein
MTDTPTSKELKLFPSWKQALADLELAGIQPGQTIEKDWLEEKFGLTPASTIADASRNQALFRTSIWQLRETLLSKHKLMLRAVGGVGYRVVEPEKQTEQALRDRGEEIARALCKLHDEVTYVRLDALDDSQRKANADALAKVGALLSMSRKQLGMN